MTPAPKVDPDLCGTTRGYQAHMRAGTKPDAACKRARADYMREYRQKNRDAYRKQREAQNAQSRALWRLAHAHPAEFRRLVLEEQARAEEQAFRTRTSREYHNRDVTT